MTDTQPAEPAPLPVTVVHVAGLNVQVPRPGEKRCQIQRCAACGATLAYTEESAMRSSLLGADGNTLVGGHVSFPPGALVRFTQTDGDDFTAAPAAGNPMPLDFCGYKIPDDLEGIVVA